MNLYLDDNSVKASLGNQLRRAGHQVTLPADFGLAGASDPRHMASCTTHGLVLLTRDHDDFSTCTTWFRQRTAAMRGFWLCAPTTTRRGT